MFDYDYDLAAITNIESPNAINDGVERGRKQSSDFLSASKSKGHYQERHVLCYGNCRIHQDVLQVVEKDRYLCLID